MKHLYEQELNAEQLEAVKTIHGPLLIIAGAGSGKTRVITYRISHMLSSGIPQASILALTFTNKAAKEMETRVKDLTQKKLTNLTIGTFHAFGVKILRNCIASIGYRENFSIYDEVDKASVIKEVARELKYAPESLDLQKLSTFFSRIKTGQISWNRETSSLKGLYREYQEHLKLYNAVDFDDLIMLPIDIFTRFPELLEEYRKKYSYIMVDEFQDTSIAQYRLMKLLADGSRNICVVGDDDQSIYSWRGANYENIIQFEKDYPERIEIKLEQNYRSTGTILAAANKLIAHNTKRKNKELWTGIESGTSIELFLPEHEQAEGEFISDTIKTLALREQVRYHDIGVLVRTNSLTAAIEEAFLSRQIPYRVSGGMSFFQRKEVKDIISYLRIIANADDDVSLLRIINTPRRGIGKKTLEYIIHVATQKKCSLYSAISAICHASDALVPEKTKADLDNFLSIIEYYRERLMTGKNMAESVHALVEAMDYWGYLILEHPKNEKIARWKYNNIATFISFLKTWERDPDTIAPSLYGYLNRISLITREDDTENEDKGKVNLMTIHSAKGLEFDVVFLAGVEDHIIPHMRAMDESEANIEEERRLFYVAITRAKKKLIMTACRKRRYMKETIESAPSRFLQEIPQDLLEYKKEEHVVEEEEAKNYFSNMKRLWT